MWELDHKEGWMPKNWYFQTVMLEKSLENPLNSKRSNQSSLKEINPEHSLEGLMWSWSSNTLAIWCKELTHQKRPWCWKRLKAGGEGGNRGWDGWMASLTQRTWVWANSGSWWWTGKPGVLWFTGSQRVGHDWASEKQQQQGSRQVIMDKISFRFRRHLIFWGLADFSSFFSKNSAYFCA